MDKISIYNKGSEVGLPYDSIISEDGSKTLLQDIESLEREGGVSAFDKSDFSISRIINADGTWKTSGGYPDYFHTGYIPLKGVSRVTATYLMDNRAIGASAVLYDRNKAPLAGGIFIGAQSIDILTKDYVGAAYICFQSYGSSHASWSNVGYKLFVEEGTITSIKKDVGLLKKSASGITKKIVLNGDSLCNQLGLQLMNICHSRGYELLNRTRGGENIIGNLTRAGGLTARVKNEFTMPSSGQVEVSLNSSWMYSDGSYAITPYNWTPNDGQAFWIKGVKGKLFKQKMVAVIAYDSTKNVLSTYTDNGNNYAMPSGTAFIKVNINAVNISGEPHVLINSQPVDVSTLCSISGYINADNSLVSNSNFKHSDYISVNSNRLYFDGCASPEAYVFERDEAGASFKVGVGAVCFDNRLLTDKQHIHIWFSGQNNGFKTPNEYADMTNAAARSFGENFVVVTTHTENCTNEIINAATAKFGNKYLNIRDYLAGNGIYDALRYGLLSNQSLTPSDWEAQFLDSAKVHQNCIGAYIEAVQIWNRLVDLQFVDGERIDDASCFVDTIEDESKVAKWYQVPEDGYGENYPSL